MSHWASASHHTSYPVYRHFCFRYCDTQHKMDSSITSELWSGLDRGPAPRVDPRDTNACSKEMYHTGHLDPATSDFHGPIHQESVAS